MNSCLRQTLSDRGVVISNPDSCFVDESVSPARIAPGVHIIGPCRITGEDTLIMEGAVLGAEGPVTLENCQLGRNVHLAGGYFKNSTFLHEASFSLGAHVREGCLIEEQAGGAHTVGLKQTILLPFVTLGSLINFCDCLMAGGTSRKHHSEVGSSYIHFNFTPNQDKATASLLGDIPRGVMLAEPPIFLGGQGGMVGPASVGFGSVITAGSIFRGACADGRLVSSPPAGPKEKAFTPGLYTAPKVRVERNITYIANLAALHQWYTHVRIPLAVSDLERLLYEAARDKITLGLNERLKRLDAFMSKLPASRDLAVDQKLIAEHDALIEAWPRTGEALKAATTRTGDTGLRDEFVARLPRASTYLAAIRSLTPAARATGTAWLQSVVDEVVGEG